MRVMSEFDGSDMLIAIVMIVDMIIKVVILQ